MNERAIEDFLFPQLRYLTAGVLLVAIVLAGLALLGGTPDGVYEPAHMENGKLIPGHFNPNP